MTTLNTLNPTGFCHYHQEILRDGEACYTCHCEEQAAMAANGTFKCDYCHTVKDVQNDYHATCGTGKQECVCCADTCTCCRRCNCHMNTKGCPECATSAYADEHGGQATLLDCDCGQSGKRYQYGVDLGIRKVCVECTPMPIKVQ